MTSHTACLHQESRTSLSNPATIVIGGVGHLSQLGRNQASEMADVTVLENQRSASSSASNGDIHHRSGQVVGANHLVGEQHPKCRIHRPQYPIAEIWLSTRLHRVDVRRAEDVYA